MFGEIRLGGTPYLSYRGLTNCTFWPICHTASLNRQCIENENMYNVQNYQSQFAEAETVTFPTA